MEINIRVISSSGSWPNQQKRIHFLDIPDGGSCHELIILEPHGHSFIEFISGWLLDDEPVLQIGNGWKSACPSNLNWLLWVPWYILHGSYRWLTELLSLSERKVRATNSEGMKLLSEMHHDFSFHYGSKGLGHDYLAGPSSLGAKWFFVTGFNLENPFGR